MIRSYKSFVNGRFLNEGIRMTLGILIPALLFAYYNQLQTGIVLSLGALCSSIADTPGPVHHRRNGMLANLFILAVVSLVTSFAQLNQLLLGIVIFLFGFIFSMLSVYGNRISSVGIAALVIMVLSLETKRTGSEILSHTLILLGGAAWYILFSLTLYRLRPYRVLQQTLGDLITDIASYFRGRGAFYEPGANANDVYKTLPEMQQKIQEEQVLVSELIYKTRQFSSESSNMSRSLMKIYIDVSELFESIMTSYQDYNLLQTHFGETGILQKIAGHINFVADELTNAGLAVKSGSQSEPGISLNENMNKLTEDFEVLRTSYMKPGNVQNFVPLGRIISNLQHITQKTTDLHYYTNLERKIKKIDAASAAHLNFTEPQDMRAALFFDNMNPGSNIFRHSLRVALALLAGFIVSLFTELGHSYWILLTIVVILKPSYSLSKQRNRDRLLGTLAGIAAGMLIVYYIRSDAALLAIMILLMLISYTFLRTHYLVSVMALTPYLIIFFAFLYPANIVNVLLDRLLDTALGSGIAFLASLFLLPRWEHESVKELMMEFTSAAGKYYSATAAYFTGEKEMLSGNIKPGRRNTLTSLANVTGSFNRMLSEPRRYQKGMKETHRFVVLGNLLTSHLATLSYYVQTNKKHFRSADLVPVKEQTEKYFEYTLNQLAGQKQEAPAFAENVLMNIDEKLAALLKRRKEELAQGRLETITKQELVETKSVTDQFVHINGLAADLFKCSIKLD